MNPACRCRLPGGLALTTMVLASTAMHALHPVFHRTDGVRPRILSGGSGAPGIAAAASAASCCPATRHRACPICGFLLAFKAPAAAPAVPIAFLPPLLPGGLVLGGALLRRAERGLFLARAPPMSAGAPAERG